MQPARRQRNWPWRSQFPHRRRCRSPRHHGKRRMTRSRCSRGCGNLPRRAARAAGSRSAAAGGSARAVASPLLPRLGAARAALANGQIEDARRLLQQTQLQLVFGPVDAPATTSRRRAEARRTWPVRWTLSARTTSPLSRRYIDVAVGDLSGIPTNPPVQAIGCGGRPAMRRPIRRASRRHIGGLYLTLRSIRVIALRRMQHLTLMLRKPSRPYIAVSR